MLAHSRLAFVGLVYAAVVAAQLVPLTSRRIPYDQIPYQVTGDNGGPRGPQLGYNMCNSTTENQQSLCQTALVNNIADFCMWSTAQTNDIIGASEAREVAWCTLPGHGTRIIPRGVITGAQWLYAKDYVQVVGYLDQTKLGLTADDAGGELDPHGDDEQGNPLGGLMYTNAYSMNSASFQQLAKSGNFTTNKNYTQTIEWVDFMGGDVFCLKLCNPNYGDQANLCNHIYDTQGCSFNAAADYAHINGTFSVCDSEDMVPPGNPNPPLPQSSNCVTYASTDLYKALSTSSTASATATSTGKSASASGGAKTTSTGSGSSSHAPAAYGTDTMPFIVVGFATMITTMLSILA